MTIDTSKITTAANDLGDGLAKGGTAAKTLGSEIVKAFNTLDAKDSALEARIAALEAGGGTQPPGGGGDVTGPTGGLITQFNPNSSGTSIIDGLDYSSHTYGGSYAKTKIDDHTIRFEIRQGDVGWSGTNNSMLEAYTHHRDNTPMTVAYRIMIEPGAAQTASWMTTIEFHNDDNQSHQATSPPMAIEILGEKFSVVARYPKNGNISPSGCTLKRLWTQPQNIVRGQWYVFEIDMKFSLTDGYLRVKVDGQQVADHSGQLGYGFDTYLMFGLYREQNPAIFANQIRNMTVSWAR